MTVDVDRARVLAYRVAAQELHRGSLRPSELAVLDLGVPDVPQGSARQALAARTDAALDDDAVVLLWTLRGAPHLHRRTDLPALAAALWPLSDADATTRIASTQIKEGARLGIAAFQAAAEAMRDAVTAPIGRGDVSTAVSARIPPSLTYWCRVCAAQHISGSLFQQVGMPAGVQIVPGTSPATLAPIDGWAGIPRRAAGTESVVGAYLRLLGPATLAEVAKYIATTQTELRPAWPDGLVEVRVDGRRTWLPEDRLEELRSAPRPRLVRLLPPSDPYLQARDRALIVPDKDRQAAVWRILGNPGALLADGEIAGVWRARMAGRRRLEVTVTPFEPLSARVRAAIDEEAAVVAAARGFGDVRVRVAG